MGVQVLWVCVSANQRQPVNNSSRLHDSVMAATVAIVRSFGCFVFARLPRTGFSMNGNGRKENQSRRFQVNGLKRNGKQVMATQGPENE